MAVCLLAAVNGAASSIVHADDLTLPVLTPQSAPELAGKRARLEFSVVEVKFAQRRQMHFLSGQSNFRSEENLPVAIREADVGSFRSAGIGDLQAKYLGKHVRAQGTVLGDEGQWLLMVTSPTEIELQDKPVPPSEAKELTIANEQGHETQLSLPLADSWPRTKLTLEHEGTQETYDGVLLATLLEKGGVRLGAEARGPLLGRYIVVSAHDGYTAVYSLGEVDPFFSANPLLMSDRLNGGPLAAQKMPLQVVVPLDKHRRRWVSQVKRIEVRNVLDKPAANASR